MGLVLMDGCQQATCTFGQKLPLLNILAVVLFGIPIFAVLIHFALRSWRSAVDDLRDRGKTTSAGAPSAARAGAGATMTATATRAMTSSRGASVKMIWALSVALLFADWVYFSAANILRLITSKPSDLKPPVGSAPLFYVGIILWALSLLALAILWKTRPREALPPMLKRTE